MLILAINPGHDGAIAAVRDRRLVLSVESEKDSFPRHQTLHSNHVLSALETLGEPPDVIAYGGWGKPGRQILAHSTIGTGYAPVGSPDVALRDTSFLGRPLKLFSSSHERSHIAMAVGMAPRVESSLHAVLVWEGTLGDFHLLDAGRSVQKKIPVMSEPGNRFAFLFGLADPSFSEDAVYPRAEDAGKLMALAAYGDPADADPAITDTVERIINAPAISPAPKRRFRDSPIHNAGVESEQVKIAAALLTERMFEVFSSAARDHLPAGIPLYISGGCGLNCDWNVKWRELGHFSSVFVPPCTNDSGSALGTALDALLHVTGDPIIDWDVYAGLEFEWDRDPIARRWRRRDLDMGLLAESLEQGQVVAWVQGRWEIGPRALGARSLLAEPFAAATRDRLNEIKQREGYRPIAPCCRLEDAGDMFDDGSEDPYMLYFRTARSDRLAAVTHVDGSARVQTVTRQTNARLHQLLTSFADRTGVGVLCNTSLNFKGFGFINRMSDLLHYCEARKVPEVVVGDAWFTAVDREQAAATHQPAGPRVATA